MDSGEIKEVGPSSVSALAGEEKKQELVMKEEDVEHQEDEGIFGQFVPGPLLPLKEHIEKDKEDESLRKWKEKLLGCLESDLNGQMEPEVQFHLIGIISSDIGEVNTPFPLSEDLNKCPLFTLRESSNYQLKLTFYVLHNIVSGLVYTNTVWKGGLEVDRNRGMLGTFAHRKEPYVHTLEEETTPSGILARGVYTAKLKFEDDDKRCHMELDYLFEIRKSN
ncbi:rho GDP-dissociation inhibitor 1-like [Henckelia pumila]|uniref:rho GDP-dissociation inhibitor 1-like n=1 Tax=Henckelia pumila TaxID=405737 RepID=UPI003C6E18FB